MPISKASRPELWLGLFFFCALLLPPLPFPFGNAGIHLAPLALLPGLVHGVVRAHEWRIRETARQRTLTILMLLFPLVALESIAFAAMYSGWEIALGSLVRVGLLGIAVWIFFYTWIGPRDTTPNAFVFVCALFWIALAAAVFACVDFYFQLPAPARQAAQFIRLQAGPIRRAQGLFYESSTLGNFCVFFLVMTLVAAFRPADKRAGACREEDRLLSRGALAAGALVFSSALIFSASRSSILALVVAGGTFLCMERRVTRRVLAGAGVALAVAAGVIWLALPEFSAHYWKRTYGSLLHLWLTPDYALAGRLTKWRVLADFVMLHPWHIIFGIGYKTLPYTSYLGAPLVADNTYLSLLVETGILGLAVFVLLNAAILRVAWQSARSKSRGTSFFGLWIFCFWCGELVQMVSGDLITYWRVLPLYFWVLAAALRADPD